MDITKQKQKEMMILAGTIKDEISRMCVTNKFSEFDTIYGQAKRNLEKLAKMIFDERFKRDGLKLMQVIYDEWFKEGNNDT